MTPLEGSLVCFIIFEFAYLLQRTVINPPKSDKKQDRFYIN
jgi:hypothetical protein